MTPPRHAADVRLHRYRTGRYHIRNEYLNVVFSDARRTPGRGDFTLLDDRGEMVAGVFRVQIPDSIMDALDRIVEEENALELDEYITP